MARGYYTRAVVVAWDYRNGPLTRRWTFDSNSSSGNSTYAGQGNHSLSVADVDQDGRQEILYGAAAIDDNGTRPVEHPHRPRRRRARRRPDPEPPGPRVLQGQRETPSQPDVLDGRRPHGPDPVEHARRAATTAAASPDDIWSGSAGRRVVVVVGLAAAQHLRPDHRPQARRRPTSWPGGTATPSRELLDGTHIDKYGTGGDTRLLTGSGRARRTTAPSPPRSLSGDLFGDWREEVDLGEVRRVAALRIYATPIPTDHPRVDPAARPDRTGSRSRGRTPPTTSRRTPGSSSGTPFTMPAQPIISTP